MATIVVAEDAVRNRGDCEQLLHRLVAGEVLEARIHHVTSGRFHLVFLERDDVTAKTLSRQSDIGATKMSDAPAALLDQMRRRQPAYRFVVHPHEAGAHAIDGPVNQNEG